MIFQIVLVCLILLTESAFRVDLGVHCQRTSHRRAPSWTTSNRDLPQALLLAPRPSSGYGGNDSKNLSPRILINYQRTRRSVFRKGKSSADCISDFWKTGEHGSADRRTVCSGLAVRSHDDLPSLRKLVECDIIDGNLEIASIDMIAPVNWSEYSLPRVREITGLLLVYNVFELPSLSTLLPSLAVIRGNTLLGNHALVVTKTSLQELGLVSLQAVLRGSIFVRDNIEMRYTDTVDFEHLTTGSGLGPPPKNIVQRDASSSEPRARCPSSCSSDADRGPRCWSARHCQAICSACSQGCVVHHLMPSNLELNLRNDTLPGVVADEHRYPSFGDRRRSSARSTSVAANQNSIIPAAPGSKNPVHSDDKCCPSERDCVGGCSYDDQQRWRGCNACHHYLGPDSCVTACPAGHQFLYQNYFCLSHAQCQQRPGHKPLRLGDQLLCLRHCPTGYREGKDGVCISCNAGQCWHECPGGMVTNISTLQAMRGCSNITGPLIIRMPALRNLDRELELALGRVVFIRDYLQIDQSVGITSLRCLGRLERIAGVTLYQDKYALYVNTNEHLRELWLSNHRLSVASGSALFVNNPRLCPALITGLLTPNRLKQQLSDHLLRAVNGHAVSCGDKIGSLSARSRPDGSVRLTWGPLDPNIASHDNILGVFVYFRETIETNLTVDRDASNCNREWSSQYVDRRREVRVTESGNLYSLPASLLRPYTQYALYLETYSSDTGTFNSDIVYTKTAVAAPGPPEAVRVSHSSSSSLEVSWRPPTAPNGRLEYYTVTYSSLPHPDQSWDHDDYCGQEDCHERQIPSAETAERSLRTASKPLTGDAAPAALHATDPSTCPCLATALEAVQIVEPIELDVQRHLVSSQHCTAPARPKRRHLDEDAQGALSRDREKVEEEGKKKNKKVQDRASVTSNERSEELDSSSVAWQTVVRGGDTLHAVISRLRHHTYYRVQVRACNYPDLHCVGQQPPARCTPLCSATPETHVFRTDPDLYADTVTSVGVAVTADGALHVSWQPPTTPNSRPRAYRLTVTRGNLTVMGHCLPPGLSPSLSTDPLLPGSYVLRIVTRTAAVEGVPYTTHFTVTQGSATLSQMAVVASLAVAAVVLLLVAAAVCLRRRRAGKTLPDTDYKENKRYPTMQPTPVGWLQDIDQAFVHSRSNLQLESTPLGSGNFGVVLKGDLELSCGAVVKVAVKQLQSTSLNDPNIAREAKIMIKLRSCHVVRSYGVVAEPVNPLLVLEYMALGDLHTFLRNEEAPNDDILTKLHIKQVVGMAAQVADGMLYLSSHSIVHRDLAARNCLLDEHGNVKVSDFGLSRPIETDSRDFYQMLDGRREIPFRSMPPEFLERGVFSFQSDVWSFGVLLWEILRAGAMPYGNLPNEEIQRSVKLGIVILQGSLPPSCPLFLERLMVQCWNFFPQCRPSFRAIIASLLPTLMEHSPKFLDQFRKDAFYYTLEMGDERAALLSRPGNCNVGYSPLSTGIIPPAPQIPLPPLPCPQPSTSAINISRPTSLHIISSFSAQASDAAHVSVSIDQQECPKHNKADRLDPCSPDVTSPTSTVSTLLSPAPLDISEETCDYTRHNHLLQRIKTGFPSIQVPLDTIRSTYSRMNLVRIKEREVKFYSSTNSVHHEATYVGHDQEGGSLNTRASQTPVLQFREPLPQGDSFYQDMSSATKRQASSKPEVYEQFESTLGNIPEPSLTESVVDDALNAPDVPECDHDNFTNIESPSTLVDPEEDLDDTLDARDLSSSSDSLHRDHHSGNNPARALIVNHGIETPPPSRNNSVGSNQASSGGTIVDLENTGQFNILSDAIFISHSSLHIE